jgi:carboxyl-terminal processing protease
VHSLSDGSGLAVTIQHYYPPKGEDINHKGIEPDVRIDLTEAQEKQLEANPSWRATHQDPQYEKAIATLSTNTFARPGLGRSAKPMSIR